MVREVQALVVQEGALKVRAVQGKTDGEQWREKGRRWGGSERRQSFWQVETVQK